MPLGQGRQTMRNGIKALTFDVGGSVFDWQTSTRRVVRELAADRGVAVDDAGRNFKALMHNHEVINRHREVCIDNLLAFHRMVEDQDVKDLVAFEFSRAAAQGMPTGFISGRADARTDASPQVLSLTARQTPSAST